MTWWNPVNLYQQRAGSIKTTRFVEVSGSTGPGPNTPRSPWGKGNIAPAQALMEVGLIFLNKKMLENDERVASRDMDD